MATEEYKSIRFKPEVLAVIDTVNKVVEDYQAQDLRLTVRQLYYQLVAHHGLENTLQSYKRVASIINDGRMAGLIDWDAIEDRTREFSRRQRWKNGADIMRAASDSYHMDMWVNQDVRPFVIIEKEALVGVLEPTCHGLDVPILAARGYPSASVLREFALSDILPAIEDNDGDQDVVIFHLGDHDPSGIDMTRDLQERLSTFSYRHVELVRLALNMDQINERKPPPNPVKLTDSRSTPYRRRFGEESWELDALPPQYLAELVREEIAERIDARKWKQRKAEVDVIAEKIRTLAKKLA